jgi:hypothetical protein
MNDAQHEATTNYLRRLADLMTLRDWEILLLRELPNNDSSWAEIEVCRTHDTAWVKVSWPEFYLVRTPEQQRETLVHELIHIHLDRPDAIMCDLTAMFPENTANQFAKDQHKNAIEFSTHRLTRALAPFLPLPPRSMSVRAK